MYFFIIFSIFAQYLEAQIVVGKNPCEVCYNPINHKLYVSIAEASIIIVDGFNNEITDSIIGLFNNHSLAYNFLNNKLYCAYGSDSIAVIDGATNQIIKRIWSANTGLGRSLYNPINNKIYFANHNSNNVSVIDGER